MANLKTHAVAGAVAGASVYLMGCWFLNKQVTLGGVVLSGLGGLASGCLPDLIEPASHPNHRGRFHSATAGGILGYFDYKAMTYDKLGDDERLAILVLSAGYFSHLILDALTPGSLPVV